MNEIPPPSEEQVEIVKAIKDNNVIVDAIAGSGKTTTILHISEAYPDRRILLLTYNARLKKETRVKTHIDFPNVECHSYHSFGFRYYSELCSRDIGIDHVLKNNIKANAKLKYDIIVIDEAQDMSPLLYAFVCKVYFENAVRARLCVVGDKNQCIFRFKEADDRYIQYAQELFSFAPYNWVNLSLSTSYRVNKQIASFVNAMMNTTRIPNTVRDNPGKEVRYLIKDAYTRGPKCDNVAIVKAMLEYYKYDDIFILAPSLRSTSTPVRSLANTLSQLGIPVFVPSDVNEALSDKVTRGKITFATFHQVKGLERKVVIIFNFDESYIQFYNKTCDPNVCPNELYVAMTRAKEKLIVIHHYKNRFLPFIDKPRLVANSHFVDSGHQPTETCRMASLKRKYSVTQLLRHISSDVLIKVMEMLKYTKDIPAGEFERIIIDIIVKQGKLYEEVSDITGIAITAYYELQNRGTCYIEDAISKEIPVDVSIPRLLKLSNIYLATVNEYTHRLNQIKEYNWLSSKDLKKCIKRLEMKICKNAFFELFVSYDCDQFMINGSVDCYDPQNNIIWEFKCCTELMEEHIIQLALYAFMVEKGSVYYNSKQIKLNEGRKYKLYNILSNELWTLTYTPEIEDALKHIIANKDISFVRTDREFLDINCGIKLKSSELI